MSHRRESVKGEAASAYTLYQQKRRAVALERQRYARQERAQQARDLLQAALQVITQKELHLRGTYHAGMQPPNIAMFVPP